MASIASAAAPMAANTPTLKKKQSWIGSIREVVHQSALGAKAVVDSLRGYKESVIPSHRLMAQLGTDDDSECQRKKRTQHRHHAPASIRLSASTTHHRASTSTAHRGRV